MVGTIPSGLAHIEATHTSPQAQKNTHATFLAGGKQEPEFHVLGTRYPSVLDWCGRGWKVWNDPYVGEIENLGLVEGGLFMPLVSDVNGTAVTTVSTALKI
ncbi:hypothetical protein N7455_007097 [Penicillium solitum]|uniref:uncharacterized protein n=1 Tax=Penicillium solitum TaxID=60172 RepID=UPI0032C465E3|nr:hypothetical protein N7455_007097 [Penicillium solitum]